MKNKCHRQIMDSITTVLLISSLLSLMACGGDDTIMSTTDFSKTEWALIITTGLPEGQISQSVNHEGRLTYSTQYHAAGIDNTSWESTLSPAELRRLSDAMQEAQLLEQEDVVEWVPGCMDGGTTSYEIQTTEFGTHSFRVGGCGGTIDVPALKAFIAEFDSLVNSYAPQP